MSIARSITFDFTAESPAGASMVNIPLNDWRADDNGVPPEAATENGNLVYLFSAGDSQKMSMFLKIPQTYPSQKQLFMYGSFYSPATSGNVLFTSTATLIRQGVDAVDSSMNQRVSTNVAITNALTANKYNQISLDLTDVNGKINSVTVVAGDMLRIDLVRGADTDTSSVRLIPSATEVAYAS